MKLKDQSNGLDLDCMSLPCRLGRCVAVHLLDPCAAFLSISIRRKGLAPTRQDKARAMLVPTQPLVPSPGASPALRVVALFLTK